MTPSILIISVDNDPHVHFMKPSLHSSGHDYVVYSPADMINEGTLNFSINNQDKCTEFFDKQRQQWFDIDQFRSIWFRRPKPITEVISSDNKDIRRFVFNEIQHASRGCLANFSGRWVNHPYQSILADYKPFQLNIARNIGFTVPDTLLTTDPGKARQFYAKHNGNIIYKAMEVPTFKIGDNYRVTYTTPIPENHSQDLLKTVSNCPALLQQYIDKRYELRVTVVDDEFFCTRIDSQAHEKSRIDWRRHQNRDDVPIQATDIPEHIKSMCLAFMRHFGLLYSAFDFIKDLDGDYVFMENNPHGQWAWVQTETQQPIAQALTTLLTRLN